MEHKLNGTDEISDILNISESSLSFPSTPVDNDIDNILLDEDNLGDLNVQHADVIVAVEAASILNNSSNNRNHVITPAEAVAVAANVAQQNNLVLNQINLAEADDSISDLSNFSVHTTIEENSVGEGVQEENHSTSEQQSHARRIFSWFQTPNNTPDSPQQASEKSSCCTML